MYPIIKILITLLLLAGCTSNDFGTSPSSLVILESFDVAPAAIQKGGTFKVTWAVTATGSYSFDFYLSKTQDASQESVLVFSYACADNTQLLPCSELGGEITCLFSQNSAGSLSIGCGSQATAIPWTGNLFAVGFAWSADSNKYTQGNSSVAVTLTP